MGEVTSVRGTIKLLKADGTVNPKTANHEAWLKEHGYEASKDGAVLSVAGSGFVADLDLSGPDNGVAVLLDVVSKRQLLTYSTRALTNKGVRFGFALVGMLGKASALVVSPASGSKAASGASPYDVI